MTNRVAAVGFRFAVAAVGLTGIAVLQVELERQTLLVKHEQVSLSSRYTDATERTNDLEVELASLTAPGALLNQTASLQKSSGETVRDE